MESSKILFDILLTDYKSLRKQKTNIFIIKYIGILSIIIMQVISGCFENYFFPFMIITLLVTLFIKDRSISNELRSLNGSMSQFTDSNLIQQYQERKYFEEKSWLRSRYYKLAEIYVWTTFSVVVLYFKYKYAC